MPRRPAAGKGRRGDKLEEGGHVVVSGNKFGANGKRQPPPRPETKHLTMADIDSCMVRTIVILFLAY